MNDYETFDLGDVALQHGPTLRDAKLAYKTYGELNGEKSNAIVYPTWYSGQHPDNEWLIGPGMALDPNRYFIIIPNMLGNGLSSSPSNTPPPYDKARFPHVTTCDNVALQHRLVTEVFGIEKLALVTGWSMGAQQTFQWGVFDGNFEAALGAIKARAIVMPGQTDLYFTPEDNEYEVSHMPDAELRTIPSIWGHFAGGGMNPEDTKFIDDALKELLAS